VDVLKLYSAVTVKVWFRHLFIRPSYSDETSIRPEETNEGLTETTLLVITTLVMSLVNLVALPHRNSIIFSVQ